MSNLRKPRALSEIEVPLLALIAGRGLVAALAPRDTLELLLATMLVEDLHLGTGLDRFPVLRRKFTFWVLTGDGSVYLHLSSRVRLSGAVNWVSPKGILA